MIESIPTVGGVAPQGMPAQGVSPQMRQAMMQMGDFITILKADNTGYIVNVNIVQEKGRTTKVYVAMTSEDLFKILMDILPEVKSISGKPCCNEG